MKKLITYLAMVSVVLASVPAAGIQAAAAADAPAVTAAAEQQKETPADIAGRWYYQESGKNVAYVMVETDGTYSYFNYAENTADGGTVKIEYDKYPDGTKAAIYSFYGNDGTFRFGCMKPETGSNVLSVGQDGTAQLTKDTKNYETAAPSDIAGRYFYQTRNEKADTYDTAGIVTVYEGGAYIFTNAAGQSVSGKVTVAYETYPDGSTAAWYNFTDDSGKFRMGCAKADDSNVLEIDGDLLEQGRKRLPAQVSDVALEYKLLLLFMNSPGYLYTRDELLNKLYNITGEYITDNTLSVHIKRLREKIGDDPQDPKYVRTVRGMGYKLGD